MVKKPEVYLAFFKAEMGTWADKLISRVDGCQYSHVELVVKRQDGDRMYYRCYSSHMADGGVRVKNLNLTEERWDLIPVPEKFDLAYALEFFQHNAQGKYDWMGLFSTILNWWPHGKKRWFCSELVSAMMQLPNPQTMGIKKLYQHVA